MVNINTVLMHNGYVFTFVDINKILYREHTVI